MKNFRAKILVLVSVILFLTWCRRPIPGEAARTYERFQSTPEYRAAAKHLAVAEEQSLGIQQMLDLGYSNPQTTLGATCLFTAAYFSAPDEARKIYQQIILGYPQSHFDVVARLSIINISQMTPPERFTAMDRLMTDFGAPTWRDVTTRHAWSVRKARELTTELKDGLMGVYGLMHRNLAEAQGRIGEALPLAIFAYEVFGIDPEVNGPLFGDVRYDIFRLAGFSPPAWAGTPDVDPAIRVLSPDGRITGPLPRISVEVWTGDYRQLPVYLSQSQFLVDGKDVRSQILVKSRYTRKPKIGRVFERDTWTYSPASPLEVGLHTVSIVAKVGNWKGEGPGMKEVSFTFRVLPSKHDNDHDNDDENDDCWIHGDDDEGSGR